MRHTCSRRNELADDHVLLEAGEVIHLTLDGGVRKDASGLLERSRRKEAIRGERRLGDTHENRVELGRLATFRLDPLVLELYSEAVSDLLGQEVRVAGAIYHDLTEHLTDDNLDM